MTTKRKNRRAEIVEATIRLVARQGVTGASIRQIASEAGVTEGALYRHFESKDELVCEALKRRHGWELDTFMKAVNEISAGDPRQTLLALFDVLHNWFTAPDFRGCQFINAAAEFPMPHDPVHQEAARHKVETRQLLRDVAQASGGTDPDELAGQIMVLFEGAITLRQVTGDDQAAATARRVAEILIEQSVPSQA